MYSAMNDAALPAPGFPIRRSAGQRLFSASPRLIAAVHVLLRLLVPRHPPFALTILTVSSRVPEGSRETNYPNLALVQFSSSSEGRRAKVFRPRSLRTEQRARRRRRATGSAATATRFGRRVGYRLARGQPALLGSDRHQMGGCPVKLPRKEVIQPQLPLRLPCYDFTPITSPTFDGCLP